MKITYKWFIIPAVVVAFGLVLRLLAYVNDDMPPIIAEAGQLLPYIGGMTIVFLLIAYAVIGAQEKQKH